MIRRRKIELNFSLIFNFFSVITKSEFLSSSNLKYATKKKLSDDSANREMVFRGSKFSRKWFYPASKQGRIESNILIFYTHEKMKSQEITHEGWEAWGSIQDKMPGRWPDGGRRSTVARWTRRRAAPPYAPIPDLTWPDKKVSTHELRNDKKKIRNPETYSGRPSAKLLILSPISR